MIKHSAVAGLALALVAGSAFAADLPYRKAPIVEPPPPVFTWTGLYGGINIGYGFGNGDQDQGGLGYAPYNLPFDNDAGFITLNPAGAVWTIPNDLNGVLGGGQAGYNYQFNPWLVVGLEADLQATDVHSQGNGYGAASDALGVHTAYATPEQERRLVRHRARSHRRDDPVLPESVGLRHGRPRLWRRGPQRQRFGLLPVIALAAARAS